MTTSMPWVKLYTEMLDDPKLGRLTPSLRWRFVEMVLLAGECDAEGYLVSGGEPLTFDDISWRLRGEAGNVEENLNRLRAAGLMDCIDGTWVVCKFAERQGRSQSEKREQWRERQQRHRENAEDVTQVSPVTHAIEKSREEESREEKIKEEDTRDDFETMRDLCSELTGLPMTQPDITTIQEFVKSGITEDDIRTALQWRKDNNLPPVKRVGGLAGGVMMSHNKRVQDASAKPNGNGRARDYTAGIPEQREHEVPVDPTPPEVREKYRMQVSRFDVVMNDVPRGLRQQFGEMWIARVDGDVFVIVCEDEYRVTLARSRLRSTLERAMMARVEFEVCPTS